MESNLKNRLVTESELESVFKNTNFGNVTTRQLLDENLKEVSEGNVVGHTIGVIMVELGLVYYSSFGKMELTEKGNAYLYVGTKKKTEN